MFKFLTLSLTDNEKRVLGVINRAESPVSRPEIALRCELTFQSVSRIIKGLIDENILHECGTVNAGRGKPKTNYVINQDFTYSVGIMFGHGFVSVTLLNATGQILQSNSESDDGESPRDTIERCKLIAERMIEQANLSWNDVIGVGISIPARIKNADGGYLFPSHLGAWDDVDVQKTFQAQFTVPVFVGNDAVNSAVAESFCGTGKSGGDFYYLFLGQGLGSVAIEQGLPRLGAHSHAGEITLLVDKDQRPSTRKLQRLLRAQDIDWNGYDELPIETIQSLAVSEWSRQAAKTLTHLIEMVIAINDPPKIVIGGGLNRSLIELIVSHVALSRDTRKREVVFSTPVITAEAEKSTPSFGAAYLPLSQQLYG